MKTIGSTNNGNILLEATPAEVKALMRLTDVAQGRAMKYDIQPRSLEFDEGVEDTLEAIYEWMELKDRANVLRRMADRIDEAIKGKKAE